MPKKTLYSKNPNKYFEIADQHRDEYRAEMIAKGDGSKGTHKLTLFVYGKSPIVVSRMHHLSLGARYLWSYFAARTGSERDFCWPSIVSIAEDLGISRSQAQRLTDELREAGLIDISKRPPSTAGGLPHNEYTLKNLAELFGEHALDTWKYYDWLRKKYPQKVSRHGSKPDMVDPDAPIPEPFDQAKVEYMEYFAFNCASGGNPFGCGQHLRRLAPGFKSLPTGSNAYKKYDEEDGGEVWYPYPVDGIWVPNPVDGKAYPVDGKAYPVDGKAYPAYGINVEQQQKNKLVEQNNNNTAPSGAGAVVEPKTPAPDPDEPRQPSGVHLKDIVGDAFKKQASQIPEPEEGSGFRRLREHERLQRKEDRKVAKAFQVEQRERAILEGSIDRASPHVRLADIFREAMVKAGLKCWKAGPKELAQWRNLIEKVGSFEETERMVSHTVTNWKALQGKYEKLTGEPGPTLFLSPWGITLAKEAEGTAGGQAVAPGTSGLSPTESPRQQRRYKEAEEIANLMLARLQGQPYDEQRLTALEMGGPNAEWIKEHLDKLRYYELKRDLKKQRG